MTTTRNAIHQPRNFDPTQYEYVNAFDNEAGSRLSPTGTLSDHMIEMIRIRAEMRALLRNSPTSAYARDERGSQCDHCGAHLRYVAVLRHTSGDHIAVGETCLDNRVGMASQAAFRFQFIRTAAANERARQARLDAQAEFVAANPAVAMLVGYEGSNDFFVSLSEQLLRNGSLSERQVAAVERSVARDAERAARDAERAAEPKVPAPVGKQTVTGEVVGLKWHENDFGGCLKMTVKDDRGFCVWVTVPAALSAMQNELERGDRVTFSATLEQSDRDESFAFGKRPTKAARI
jgi:hypothetical protein